MYLTRSRKPLAGAGPRLAVAVLTGITLAGLTGLTAGSAQATTSRTIPTQARTTRRPMAAQT